MTKPVHYTEQQSAELAKLFARIVPGGGLEKLLDEAEQLGELAEQQASTHQDAPAPTAGNMTESLVRAKRAIGASPIRSTIEGLIRDPRNLSGDPSNLFNTEAIVRQKYRPASLIKNDSYADLPAPWQHLNDPATREKIGLACRSIGRVELPKDSSLPYGGTGFIVGKDLLMTNRHVAELFLDGYGIGPITYKPGHSAIVDFLEEHDNPDVFEIELADAVMIHPYWDMALIKTKPLPESIQPLTLSRSNVDDLLGDDVVVIGYPAYDARNGAAMQRKVFGDIFDVKRLMPGNLMGRSETSSFNRMVDAMTHDCSTLGGNSGSAVLNVRTGAVVGLHFAGRYLEANFAIASFDLASDPVVVEHGVQFEQGTTLPDPKYGPLWNIRGSSSVASGPSVGRSSPDVNAPHPGITAQPTMIEDQSISPDRASRTIRSDGISPIDNAGIEHRWQQTIEFTVKIGPPTAIPDRVDDTRRSASTQSQMNMPRTPAVGADEGMFGRVEPTPAELRGSFRVADLDGGNPLRAAYCGALAARLAYYNAEMVDQVAVGFWQFEQTQFFQRGSAEAFVASVDDMALLVFRGTDSIRDWLADAKVLATERVYGGESYKIHRGFYGEFAALADEVKQYLRSTAPKRLHFAGHSLGGAMAVVATAELHSEFPATALHTFGQPAVGRGNFADHMNRLMNDRYLRVVNDDDVIAQVPPTYRHAGKLIHLGHGQYANTESPARSSSATLTGSASETMSEDEFAELQDRLNGRTAVHDTGTTELGQEAIEGIFPSFADHRIDHYVTKLEGLSSDRG